MAAHVEIVSRETIKPSCPTPKQLRQLKLSFFDQFAPIKYPSVLLLYPNDAADHHSHEIADKIQLLKSSLSEILTHYYPLAGAIKENTEIECDDDGVEFVEAKVNCLLSEFLKEPDVFPANKLLPREIWSSQAATAPLLAIQGNFFSCGGLVIAVSISHKIADASTMSTFIKAWSATARGKMSEDLRPVYVLGSLYPPKDFLSSFRQPADVKKTPKTTRRYVFEGSKLAKLKSEAASDTVHQPTRVEAVTALIWKSLMTASRTNVGYGKPLTVLQNVNMRKRHVPPLPDNCPGNFTGHFAAHDESRRHSLTGLKGLVVLLRKSLEDYVQFIKTFHEGDAFQAICESAMNTCNLLKEKDGDSYVFSSWCNFPFYESDFGWGKPKWVTVPFADEAQNSILMVDSVDGKGIEVWLTCNEECTASLDCNEELLKYASLKSSLVLG